MDSDSKKALQRAIHEKRHASLIAARKGDFRAVARLTSEVTQLNNTLRETSRPEQPPQPAPRPEYAQR